MERQSQQRRRENTYQGITLYQAGTIEDTIDAWVDDIATNSGSKGLSMAAFKAVSDEQAYNDKDLQREMKSNKIFESVKALRDIYKDENPAEKFNMDNVNPSEIRAVMNKYIGGVGKAKAAEAELARRNKPMPRQLGAERASAPPAQDDFYSKPVAHQEAQIPSDILIHSAAEEKYKPRSENIYEAALNNDIVGIKRFLASGVSVNNNFDIDNKRGLTALHGASNKNNLEAIDFLLENCANINSSYNITYNDGSKSEGITPLHEAVKHNKVEAINALIAQGANINLGRTKTFGDCKKEGITPLHEAAKNNKVEAINALIAQGANINAGRSQTYNNGLEIKDLTPLHDAVISNSIEAINALIAQGANINAGRSQTDNNGSEMEGITPLHEAATRNNVEVIKTLIKKGANMDAKDSNGDTPISIAVYKENIDSAVQIKKAGGEFGRAEKYIPKLNKMLKETLEKGGLTNRDKIRDLFFVGAQMPDLQDQGIAFKTMLKEIYKQAKKIPINTVDETPIDTSIMPPAMKPPAVAKPVSSHTKAQEVRRQQQVPNNQAECCVIM